MIPAREGRLSDARLREGNRGKAVAGDSLTGRVREKSCDWSLQARSTCTTEQRVDRVSSPGKGPGLHRTRSCAIPREGVRAGAMGIRPVSGRVSLT